MARKIKDAKDLTTNELIYFKGHAKATYMSDGRSVEDAINNIAIGGEVQITKAPIATSYAIYFDDSNPMLPGKVYVGYSGYTIVEIQTLTPPTGTYGEYKLHFYAPSASTTISLPDYVLLANGEIATPEAGSYYELSIVATRESLYDSFVYSAVLTPFKSI